jgi:hypothetical protein
MRKTLFLLTLSLSLTVSLEGQTTTPAPAPARTADDVARRAIDMLAGPEWAKARYFRFTFDVLHSGKSVARYPQQWDRQSGDYRLTGPGPRGDRIEVIMNVNTMKGRVWRDGELVENSAELLDFAFKHFVSDTYFLLMPLKTMDPGVQREYVGERSDSCGTMWDVVKLTFGSGEAQDQSWMWVNRDTGLVDEWDTKPALSKPEDPALRVYFHDYRRFGGLLISTRREFRDKNQEIRLEDIVIASEVPKDAFAK